MNQDKKVNKCDHWFALIMRCSKRNIEGKNLVNAIYLCKDVIAPESGITHIGSFLSKNTLALMHFNFQYKSDIFRS